MFSVSAYISSKSKKELYTPLKVNPDLRGYNYDNPELTSRAQIQKDKGVSITGMAIIHCPSGRDLYFDKHKSFNTLSWPRVLGVLVDRLLVPLFDEGVHWLESKFEEEQVFADEDVRSHLYAKATDMLDEVVTGWKCTWEGYKNKDIEAIAELISPGNGFLLLDNSRKAIMELVDAEITALLEHIEAYKKEFGTEWVLNFRESCQLRTEVRLDEGDTRQKIARVLGLNSGVKPDFLHSVTLVGDLKTSKDAVYYDTVMAGYAIFLESVLNKRVNTAAVFLVDLDVANGKFVNKTIRLVQVNDSLRKGWRIQRDWALDIANGPSVPPLPINTTKCLTCKYLNHCWINGVIGHANPSAM